MIVYHGSTKNITIKLDLSCLIIPILNFLHIFIISVMTLTKTFIFFLMIFVMVFINALLFWHDSGGPCLLLRKNLENGVQL